MPGLPYTLQPRDDGSVDVYLRPAPDAPLIAVRGVDPFDGLEEDIRRRFDAWCASGEPIPGLGVTL